MNKKGFTLIELLATLVILSIIMLVAVPSTLSVIEKNKRETYVSDAKRLVALAESEVRNNDTVEIGNGQAMVFSFEKLDDGSFEKDADGNKYQADQSFVVVYRNVEYNADGTVESYQYNYYVQLYGEKRGIDLEESKLLVKDSIISFETQTEERNTKIKNLISENTGKTVTSILEFTNE